MKPEDRFLFLAARQQLQPDHVRRMEAIAASASFNWGLVFSTAERNGIAPLLYIHVTGVPALAASLPGAVRDQYRLYVVRNSLFKKERARQLSQALQFFHERNIQVIVFKGAAQELLVYDEPWYTVSDDIDLILSSRRESLPVQLQHEISHAFHRKRVEFDYFEHHDMTINGMLPVDFNSVWQQARPIDCHGEPGLVLSPEDHLLAICVNSCRKRFFRLKALFDIHETIRKCEQLDWQKFCERCRAFDCGNIVYTALLIASRTLETPIPNPVMGQLGVSALRSALIRSGVWLLLKFWTLTMRPNQTKIFNRLIDPNLILLYLTYRPNQIAHKIREIRTAQKPH